MQKFWLYLILLAFVVVYKTVYSAERARLGNGNIAIKLDYIIFTDKQWSGPGDDGIYLGIEGYGEILPNIYLGGELGNGVNMALLDDEMTLVPIELNSKYAIEASPDLVIDLGVGVSYNYAKIRIDNFFSPDIEEKDWLLGGQIFADATYKIKKLIIGINGKYQITANFKDDNFDLNNLRLGIQIGMIF